MKTCYRILVLLLFASMVLSGCQPIQPPIASATAEVTAAPVAMPAPANTPEPADTPEPAIAEAPAEAAQPAPTPGAPPRVDNESFWIESQALAGNAYGNPTLRQVFVLLPPSYAESDKHYPVLYLMPYGDGDAYSTASNFEMDYNSLLRHGGAPELIVVIPDGQNVFGMGQFRSSSVLGDYETYATQEVVDYVDGHYRTLPQRESRGIAGCSSGGFSSMRIALRHPELYSAVASTGGIYDEAMEVWPTDVEYAERLTRLPKKIGDWMQSAVENWYYYAAAEAAPNPGNAPFYADAPMRLVDGHGEFVPEVIDRIVVNDSVHAAQTYVEQPLRYNGILILEATSELDPAMIPAAESFDGHLTELGIDHEYRSVVGSHCPDRWEWTFLDYMQEKLTAQ